MSTLRIKRRKEAVPVGTDLYFPRDHRRPLAVLTTIYLLFGRPDGSIAVNRDTLEAAHPDSRNAARFLHRQPAGTDRRHDGRATFIVGNLIPGERQRGRARLPLLNDDKLVSIFDGKTGSYNVYDRNVLLSSEGLWHR